MMSVESEICRRAALIQPIRSRYHSGVYSLAISLSTRAEPDCTGRCTWSQSVGTASIGLHDVAGKVARVAGGKAYAPNARHLAHGSQQFREAPLPFRVAIAVHVLAQQLNLGVAQVGDAPRLFQHGGRGAAALFAARVRHHAVGAELVAAFDDGDVAAVGILPGGELGLEGLFGLAVVEAGNAVFAGFQPRQHLRQLAIGGRSGDERDVGRPLEDLFALLLGHAPQHAKALAGLVQAS